MAGYAIVHARIAHHRTYNGFVVLDAASMATQAAPVRVLLVEPNVAVRSEIVELLSREQYEVQVCDSLDQVVRVSGESRCDVALVAWSSMGGLLVEEHRHDLVEYVRRLHLVVMVGQSWARLLDAEDLGGAHILEKPFDGDELLARIREARSAALASLAGGAISRQPRVHFR